MRGHKSRGYQRLRAPKSAVRVAPKRELEISVFSRSSERGYAFTECLRRSSSGDLYQSASLAMAVFSINWGP
jgi:hypothetical protein